MDADLIKRRQLLKNKLEGKTSDDAAPTKIRNVNNTSRLHIPTIFQKGADSLRSSLSKNISKSTGSINKESKSRTVDKENAKYAPAKPPRKSSVSSSFYIKIDLDKKKGVDSQIDTKLKASKSMIMLKKLENNTNSSRDDRRKLEGNNYEENSLESGKKLGSSRFFANSVSHDSSLSIKSEKPVSSEEVSSVIVFNKSERRNEESISHQKKDTETKRYDESEIENGLMSLRNRLKDLRNRKGSADPSSLSFNFVDQSSNPKSSVYQKLEQIPNLKRSGSRAGFRFEVKKEETMENDIYENPSLNNMPFKVQSRTYDSTNEEIDINIKSSIPDKEIEEDERIGNGLDNHFERNKEMKRELLDRDDLIDDNRVEDELCDDASPAEENQSKESVGVSQIEEDIGEEHCEQHNHILEREKEKIYENIDVFRENYCYSRKFIMGPVCKIPIPSKRNILSNRT